MVEYYPRLVAIKKAGYEARPVLVQYLLASMIVRMRKVFAGSLGSSLHVMAGAKAGAVVIESHRRICSITYPNRFDSAARQWQTYCMSKSRLEEAE